MERLDEYLYSKLGDSYDSMPAERKKELKNLLGHIADAIKWADEHPNNTSDINKQFKSNTLFDFLKPGDRVTNKHEFQGRIEGYDYRVTNKTDDTMYLENETFHIVYPIKRGCLNDGRFKKI